MLHIILVNSDSLLSSAEWDELVLYKERKGETNEGLLFSLAKWARAKGFAFRPTNPKTKPWGEWFLVCELKSRTPLVGFARFLFPHCESRPDPLLRSIFLSFRALSYRFVAFYLAFSIYDEFGIGWGWIAGCARHLRGYVMESGGGREAIRPVTAEEEAMKRNTDCVYFLASPLTCKKVAFLLVLLFFLKSWF